MMSLPEDEPKPEEPKPPEGSPPADEIFSEEPVLPEGFTPLDRNSRLPRARRRRARRMLAAPSADERAALLDNLGRQAFPSVDFFLYAFFCSIVLGAAYLLDAPALLLLGLILAPVLSPWVGMTLAIQTGSWRFFFLTLGGMIVASGLVFLGGWLAGLAGHLWLPLPLFHASIHSHLWWLDLFLVVLGAVVTTVSFVRSEHKPVLASLMLAYGLFLPLNAGGLGLGIGKTPMWPDGVLVFLVHLALAILVSCITLAAMRFKPAKAGGYILPILLGLLSLAALVYFTGLTNVIRDTIIATRRAAPTPTTAVVLPSMTPTATQTAPSTPTPTITAAPSNTLQPSATVEPTPSYAVITSPSGGGACIRSEPGGGICTVLTNGITVQVLPEIQSVNGINWVRVIWNDVNGWVLSSVLTATTESPPATFTPTP